MARATLPRLGSMLLLLLLLNISIAPLVCLWCLTEELQEDKSLLQGPYTLKCDKEKKTNRGKGVEWRP